MKAILLAIQIAAVACGGCPVLAQDETRATEAEALRMIEDALGYIKEVGVDKAFSEFSDRENKRWQYKDLYVFCSKFDGMTDCHGANRALLGKNLYWMQTVDGQYFVKDSSDLVLKSGSGWLNYKRANPQTKQVEDKKVFVIAVPGYDGFIGTGIFRPLPR
jgi:cytochrome c